MKHLFSFLFALVSLAPVALAQDLNITLDGGQAASQIPGCGSLCDVIPEGGDDGFDTSIIRERTIIEVIVFWTNFILAFMSLIAMVMMIYFGFLYVTARGEDEQTGTAKKGILYVVIAIILLMSLYAIVNTLIFAGMTNGLEPPPG